MGMGSDALIEDDTFTSFATHAEPRLRRALVAGYGPDVGADACAEAMAFAWQRWDEGRHKHNPVGYLWGVGRNHARRATPRPIELPPTTRVS